MPNKKVFIFFAVLFCCSLRLAFAQKIAIRSADTGNYISIISYDKYDTKWLNLNKPDTLFLGLDKAVCKANYDYLLFYVQKSGYRNCTQLVKRVDLIRSKTTYRLKKLQPLPSKADTDQFIFVEKVSFNVDEKKYIKKNYEEYDDYMLGKVEGTASNKTEIKYENTIFFDSLNNFLYKNGYVDTTEAISFGDKNMVKISIEVTEVIEHLFGNFMVAELVSKVRLLDAWGKSSSFEKTYSAKSDITFSQANSETGKRVYTNALENLLCELIADKELSEKFVSTEKRMKEVTTKWDTIAVNNKISQETNIENAAASVVTIKLKKGHGSGCVISADGYVITNYHVIEDADTNNIEAVFNEGNKIKCKIIRSNPFYDLALLKIDTIVKDFVKINAGKNIKLGADVYAIGTPKDVGLGQSITKGIVSGKRNIDNKTYIQSDVSVNKGNSGGAMVNKEGELIGIVSAKLIGVGIEGVGFAIPSYYLEEALKIKVLAE